MVLRTGVSGGGIHGAGYTPIGAMGGCPSGAKWYNGAYAAWEADNAASYAASLLDVTGNGNTLAEIGGGAVNWAAGTGWSGFSALTRCLSTGIIFQDGWSIIAKYSGAVAADRAIFGASDAAATVTTRIAIVIWNGGVNLYWMYGNAFIRPPGLAAAILGMTDADAYRNGVSDGIAPPALTPTVAMYIGAWNRGGVSTASYFDGSIQKLGIWDYRLSAADNANKYLQML